MTMPTVAVTTAANAAAMMKATASSTRLPLRMKFLKPVMTPPRPRSGSPWFGRSHTLARPGVAEEPRDAGLGDRGHRRGRHAHHHDDARSGPGDARRTGPVGSGGRQHQDV